MTLLTNPLTTPAAIPQLKGVLRAGFMIARAVIDVLAGLLSAPPWRGDAADLYSGNSRAEPIVLSRIERLCSYETSRFP